MVVVIGGVCPTEAHLATQLSETSDVDVVIVGTSMTAGSRFVLEQDNLPGAKEVEATIPRRDSDASHPELPVL